MADACHRISPVVAVIFVIRQIVNAAAEKAGLVRIIRQKRECVTNGVIIDLLPAFERNKRKQLLYCLSLAVRTKIEIFVLPFVPGCRRRSAL